MSEGVLDFVHNGNKVFHTFIPHLGNSKNSNLQHLLQTSQLSQDGAGVESAEVKFSLSPRVPFEREEWFPVSIGHNLSRNEEGREAIGDICGDFNPLFSKQAGIRNVKP